MQTAPSKIWTQITVFISYDNTPRAPIIYIVSSIAI